MRAEALNASTPATRLRQGFAGVGSRGRRSFSEGGKRVIQYAAAYRLNRYCLWNTGSPGQSRAMTAFNRGFTSYIDNFGCWRLFGCLTERELSASARQARADRSVSKLDAEKNHSRQKAGLRHERANSFQIGKESFTPGEPPRVGCRFLWPRP